MEGVGDRHLTTKVDGHLSQQVGTDIPVHKLTDICHNRGGQTS